MHQGEEGKKLEAAARALVGVSSGVSEKTVSDAERFEKLGLMAPGKAEEIGARRADDVLEIHPDNQKAFRVFQASLSQWRYAGISGVATGLDYTGVEAVCRAMNIKWKKKLFESLQLMETVAIKEMVKSR